MTALSLSDKVVAIHSALTDGGIDHAFGGAIALAYYSEPRATVDIDVNVFVPTGQTAAVQGPLERLGIEWTVPPDLLERDGQCRLRWDRNPVDLFFSYDDVHLAMARAIRIVPFGESTIPILSPEHLMVCKCVFDRPKDWLDIEQMMLYVDHLDAGEVRRWLAHIVGETDRRYIRAETMLALRTPSPGSRPPIWPTSPDQP